MIGQQNPLYEVRLTPDFVQGAPGDEVRVDAAIRNTAPSPETFFLRWVGVDADALTIGPIEPGATETVPFVITVPHDSGAAERLVGLEVASEHHKATLTELQLVTTSNAGVRIAAHPKTVRGRRGGRFEVEISNRSTRTERLELGGGEGGITVDLPAVSVRPGQTTRVSGSIKTRGHLGEERRRVIPLWATGDGPSNRTVVTLIQPSMLPLVARKATAIVAVLALWASLLAGGVAVTRKVTGDGSKTDEQAAELLARSDEGADGDAAGGAGEGEGGSGGADGTAGADGEEVALRGAEVSGLVDVGSGEPGGVAVTLRPVELGDQPPSAKPLVTRGLAANAAVFAQQGPTPTTVGGSGDASGDPGKVWSQAQAAEAGTGALTDLRTTDSNADGEWGFAGIPFPGLYEVVFAKAGFNTASYVVTVDSDEPVHFDVTLTPGRGTLAGMVRSDTGPLADVDIAITDGSVTYRTSTTDLSGAGAWSMDGLGTPARYSITFSRRGYGTETLAVDLSTGQSLTGLTANMRLGVGSISGIVFHGGQPLGGTSVVVSDGKSERSSTTLTTGAVGSYLVPQLTVGTTYTVTFERPGFISQTLTVELADNESGINADLRASTASVYGTVTDSVSGDGVGGVGISLTNGTEVFKSTTTVSPPGSFELNGLPPGSYVVEFGRFEYEKASALLNVVGGDRIQKDIALVPRPTIVLPANASVSGTVLASGSSDGLAGARVKILGHPPLADGSPAETTTAAGGRYSLAGLSLGTWSVEIQGPATPKFQPVKRTVRLGSNSSETVDVTLLPLGSFAGTITSGTGTPLSGVNIKIDGIPALLQSGDGGLYKSGDNFGDGTYRVTFSKDEFQSSVKDVAVRVGETTTLDVVLYKFPTVSGRVLRPVGAPVVHTGLEGMLVSATNLDNPSLKADVTTDRSGQYVIPVKDLPPGRWQITASQPATSTLIPGFAPTMVQRTLDLGQSLTLDLVLSPKIGVTGSVTWKDVNDVVHPVVDAEITARDVLTAYAPALTSTAQLPVQTAQLTGRSLADGSWRIDGQIGGRSPYAARGAGLIDGADTEVTVIPGQPEPSVAIVLQPAPQSLSGQLFPRPGGTPDGFTVKIDPPGVNPSNTTTANDGRFTISGLRPGSYRVTFSKVGFADLVTSGVVPLGAAGDMGSIYADQLANLTVTVSSRVGEALLVGAQVKLFAPGSTTELASGTTKADGTITFPNLQPRPAEPYTLKVSGPLHIDADANASVTNFGENATAGVALDRRGAVTGVVRTDIVGTTAPVADLTVTLKPVGASPGITMQTDANGSYRFDNVTAGRYTISATRPGFTQNPPATSVELEVTNNADTSADVVLARRAAITGVLSTDVLGVLTPLGSTNVTLTPKVGIAPPPVATKADGSFRFENLPAGDYTLSATKAGFTQVPAAATVTVTAILNQDVRSDVIVARDAAIWGVLSTDVLGVVTPLGSTNVTLTLKGTTAGTSSPTITDGSFRFEGLQPGVYVLAASKTGFAQDPAVQEVTAVLNADTQADITLLRDGALTGVVYGQLPDGSAGTNPIPLASAKVTATRAGTPHPVDTGPDGRYRIDNLAPGAYTLTVTMDGFTQPVAPTVTATVEVNKDAVQDVTLLRNAAIVGTLFTDRLGTRTAAPNTFVTLTATTGSSPPKVSSDSEGRFRFDNLAPGSYTLRATIAGFTQTAPDATVTAVVNTDFAVDVVLERKAAIIGTVSTLTLSAGAILPNAKVSLTPVGSTTVTTVDADSNGDFRFSGLAPGPYTLSATKAGFTQSAPATAVTAELNTDVTANVVLERNGAIVGTISSGLGSGPLVGATVTATPAGGSAPVQATTVAGGLYRIEGLSPGDYDVSVAATNHLTSATVTVRVDRNIDSTSNTTLTRRGLIEGVIKTNTKGTIATMPSALVTLTPTAPVGAATTATAGSGGQFIFDNLGEGAYTLTVAKPGYVQTGAQVNVSYNQSTVGDVTLVRLGALVGTVTAVRAGAETPVSGIKVFAKVGSTTVEATTSGTGAYRIDGLPAEEYTVSVNQTGYTQTSPAAAVVGLNEDTTADVTLTADNARLSGKVISDTNGTALAGVTVRATYSVGGTASSTSCVTPCADLAGETGLPGTFAFPDLPPTAVTLSFEAPNHHNLSRTATTLSPGSTTAVGTITLLGNNGAVVGTVTWSPVGFTTKYPQPTAALTLTRRQTDGTFAEPRNTTSDMNGAFSFAGLDKGTYKLATTHADFQTVTSTAFDVDGATSTTTNVNLTPVKRTLVVEVESSRGGPAVGASVQLSGGAGSSGTLITTSSGTVTFTNVNPGPIDVADASQYVLTVTGTNFVTANKKVVVLTTGDTSAVIDLIALATVTVPVAFDPTSGSATSTVTLVPVPLPPSPFTPPTQSCKVTCTFARVVPGTYQVSYGSVNNYAPPASTDVTVTPTENLSVPTGTYRRYAKVTLKIADPNSTGVTSATVSPRPANASSDTIARNTVMNLVPDQTYTFSVEATPNVNQAVSTSASFTTNQTADQNLTVAGEGKLSLVVQNSSGTALTGTAATVSAATAGGPSVDLTWDNLSSRYMAGGLAAGTYTVSISGVAGHEDASASATIASGTTSVTKNLTALSTVSGNVRSEGSPVPSVPVTLESTTLGSDDQSSRTDGTYSFGGLVAGSRTLKTAALGSCAETTRTVSVAGAITADISLVTTLVVNVVDSSGVPTDATLTFGGGKTVTNPTTSIRTGLGTYAVTGVVGVTALTVTATASPLTATSSPQAITACQDALTLTITLPAAVVAGP